jgi:hypothetical protein
MAAVLRDVQGLGGNPFDRLSATQLITAVDDVKPARTSTDQRQEKCISKKDEASCLMGNKT